MADVSVGVCVVYVCVCAWEDGLDFGVFAQTNFVSESLDSDDSKSLSLFFKVQKLFNIGVIKGV